MTRNLDSLASYRTQNHEQVLSAAFALPVVLPAGSTAQADEPPRRGFGNLRTCKRNCDFSMRLIFFSPCYRFTFRTLRPESWEVIF